MMTRERYEELRATASPCDEALDEIWRLQRLCAQCYREGHDAGVRDEQDLKKPHGYFDWRDFEGYKKSKGIWGEW